MKCFGAVIASVVLGSMIINSAAATDLSITSFGRNGVITWTNALSNAAYRVEWASSPTSSWTTTWANLTGIQSTTTICSSSVPMFYRVVAQQPPIYSATDYWPNDPNIYGRHVLVQTNYFGSFGGVITNEITTFIKIPYTSGTIVGFFDGSEGYYNDGHTARMLGSSEMYLSDDTNLSRSSSFLSFSQFYDGMLTTGSYANVWPSPGPPPMQSAAMMLWRIQNITVPAGTYTNCAVGWQIDPGNSYVAPDMLGVDSELGLTIPTSAETQGHFIYGVMCRARNVGGIARGNFSPSGELVSMETLQAVLPCSWTPPTAPLALSPSSASVVQGGSLSLTASGGSGLYSWSMTIGNLSSTTGSAITYTAPASSVTATVWVVDSDGQAASCTITVE